MNEVESRWGEWPNLLLTLAIAGVAWFFKSIEMPTVAFWMGMIALVIFVESQLKRLWRKTIRPAIIELIRGQCEAINTPVHSPPV